MMEAEGEESDFSFYNSIQSDLIIKRHIIFILKEAAADTENIQKSDRDHFSKQKRNGAECILTIPLTGEADPSHQKYRESPSA